MRLQNRQLISLCLPVVFAFGNSCGTSSEDRALDLVHKSIAAHGGQANWHDIKEIGYQKQTILYTPDGSVEMNISQKHIYRLKPQLEGAIYWSTPNDTFNLIYKNDVSILIKNGRQDTSQANLAKAIETFEAGFFTLCQPFKLLDKGSQLTYLGLDTLEDGKIVEALKVEYPEVEFADTWWYFFDPISFLVIGNMVDHGKGISYIRNLAYDESTNLIFNSQRKSFNIDSARNIQSHRADYFNTNFYVE